MSSEGVPEITDLVATVRGKRYRLVPKADCHGCAFERECRAKKDVCPVFNDYTLASDVDVVYKEVKE